MSRRRTALPLGEGADERELSRLTHTLARRIGRYLERQRVLERDAENSYLAGDGLGIRRDGTAPGFVESPTVSRIERAQQGHESVHATDGAGVR